LESLRTEAIGIAERQDGDAGRRFGDEGAAVAKGLTGLGVVEREH